MRFAICPDSRKVGVATNMPQRGVYGAVMERNAILLPHLILSQPFLATVSCPDRSAQYLS